jgi:hypothetical protein
VQVPGSDLAVAVEVRGDNSGPHPVEEITKIYAGLRRQFPSAQVTAANLSEIAAAVEPYRSHLPVVTEEIGDTWIYGLRYKDAQGSLALDTLDAPIVQLGEKSPIYFSHDQPDLAKGIHFSLYNNAWGTNYIQWFGENMRFRFALRA